jgi:hypothetical protein
MTKPVIAPSTELALARVDRIAMLERSVANIDHSIWEKGARDLTLQNVSALS